MAMETVVGLLVALIVPIWLVVEQVLKWNVLAARGVPEPASGRPTAADAPAVAAGGSRRGRRAGSPAPTVASRTA